MNRNRRGLRSATLALFLLLAGLWTVTLLQAADSPGNAARGRAAFNLYCASCHGKTGRGDGPVASSLKVPPADLTRISQAHGGKFPNDQVYARIDGREAVPAHGPSDMPVWGMSFQDPGKDTDQEAAVRARIRDLVSFVESLQASNR